MGSRGPPTRLHQDGWQARKAARSGVPSNGCSSYPGCSWRDFGSFAWLWPTAVEAPRICQQTQFRPAAFIARSRMRQTLTLSPASTASPYLVPCVGEASTFARLPIAPRPPTMGSRELLGLATAHRIRLWLRIRQPLTRLTVASFKVLVAPFYRIKVS